MARRRASALAVLSLALGLLAVVAGPAPSAAALPAECLLPLAERPQHVYVWTGAGADDNWANAANWEHNPGTDPDFQGYPQDDIDNNGASDRTESVVCISVVAADQVEINYADPAPPTPGMLAAFVWVKEVHVEGPFTIRLDDTNTGLLIDGTTNTSTFGPGSHLDVRGTFGGLATIDVLGTVTATSIAGFPAQLTSRKICGVEGLFPFCPPGSLEPDYAGPAGTLVIRPGGQLVLGRRGVGLSYHYNLDIQGAATLAASPGGQPETPFLAASDGTSIDVLPGGRLTLAGAGGVYRGRILDGQPVSPLRNAGTLVKTGAGTTSVVDTDYSLEAGGAVDVQAGTLTLPEGDVGPASLAALVRGGSTLGTGTCGAVVPADGSACSPTTGSADPRSLAVTVPGADGDGASVSLREDVPAPGLAFDGTTEISGLQALPVDPARIHARLPSAPSDQGAGLDRVRVSGDAGTGDVPTCLGSGAPPYGAISCVDRRGLPTSTRVEAGNLVVEVRSVASVRRSRWIVVRESRDVAAPTVYGPTSTKAKVKVLRAKRKVRPIPVPRLRCSEACRLAGKGTLTVRLGGKKRTFTVKGARAAGADDQVTLRVRLNRNAQAKLAGSSVAKGRARLLVTARDAAGNRVSMQVVVRVRLTR